MQLYHRESRSLWLELPGESLREADLTGQFLPRVDLRNQDLTDATLAGANLVYADLTGATLERADLRGTDIGGADVCYADLTGADLRGAMAEGTDFTAARLVGANLKGLTYSRETIWPRRFDPEAAGAVCVRGFDPVEHLPVAPEQPLVEYASARPASYPNVHTHRVMCAIAAGCALAALHLLLTAPR